MSLLDEIIPEILEPIFEEIVGDAATFTPAVGDAVPCSVEISVNSNYQFAGDLAYAGDLYFLTYLRSEIDRRVKQNETFTIGASVYTVVSMADYPGSWTAYTGTVIASKA